MNDRAAELRQHPSLRDPRTLVRLLGLDRGAQRTGSGVLITCPWHADRTPSCHVYRAGDGTIGVRCHGCGQGGDALSLVAKACDVTAFPDVIRRAAEIAGMPVPSIAATEDDYSPPLTSDRYHAIASALLEVSPITRAESYLRGRSVYAEGLADGWGCLPAYHEQASAIAALRAAFDDDDLVSAGLLYRDREKGLDVEHFRRAAHALCIPWRAAGIDGQIQCLQRRLIRAPRDDREPRYVMPSGISPRTPYGADLAVEMMGPETGIAFVEGALDVLALRRGYALCDVDRVVVGIPGVSSWRASWANLAAGRLAVIALDADKAGDSMTLTMAADLRTAGAIEVVRQRPKGAKDWADAVPKAMGM